MAHELNKVIQLGGKFLKHAVGILLLCWRRMLQAGLIAALVSIALGEIVAMVMTHSLNPGGPAQLAIAALAIAVAYSAALTVLVEEFVLGAVETIRLLEGDVEAGARASAVIAEREIGEVHIGLKHLFGLAAPAAWLGARIEAARDAADARQEQRDRAEQARRQRREQEAQAAQRRTAQEQSQREQLAAQTRQRQEQADQQKRQRAAEASAAAIAATSAGAATLAGQAAANRRTPTADAHADQDHQDHPEVSVASVTQLPPVAMQPVPASSLPRIEWTYEHPAISAPPTTPATSIAPVATANDAPTDEPLAPTRFTSPAEDADAQPPAATPSAKATSDTSQVSSFDEVMRPAAWAAPAVAGAVATGAAIGLAGRTANATADAAPAVNAEANPPSAPAPTTPAASQRDALDEPTLPARSAPATRPAQSAQSSEPVDGAKTVVGVAGGATNGARAHDAPQASVTQPLKAITRPLGAVTQPLSAVTRPLPAQTRPRSSVSGGLWERLSQALVGRTPTASRPLGSGESASAEATDPFGEMRSLPPLPAEDEEQG